MRKTTIVLASSDTVVARQAMGSSLRSGHSLLTLDRPRDLQQFISNRELAVSVFVLDPTLSFLCDNKVIEGLIRHSPCAPIVWIEESSDEASEEAKPGVLRMRRNHIDHDWLGLISRVPPARVPIAPMPQTSDGMIPVQIQLIAAEIPITLDLYVRINDQGTTHFIKVARKDEPLGYDRWTSYIDKGEHWLWVKTADIEKHIDSMQPGTVKPEYEIPQNLQQAIHHGEQVFLGWLSSVGIDSKGIESAKFFVRKVSEIALAATKPGARGERWLKAYFNRLASCEHGVATAMASSLVLSSSSLLSTDRHIDFGLACLLHDIGLVDMPAKFQTEKTDGFTSKEIEIFNTHPAIGARVLTQFAGMSGDIGLWVTTHHDRMDKGIHASLSPRTLPGEVLALSNELVLAFTDDGLDVESWELRTRGGYSSEAEAIVRNSYFRVLLRS